jgi:hypothetical protein
MTINKPQEQTLDYVGILYIYTLQKNMQLAPCNKYTWLDGS